MYDWTDFLRHLSQARIAGDEGLEELTNEMIGSQWLGHPGASEAKIQVAESRLGVKLPNSYREFLKISNGWANFREHVFNFHLLPVEQIDWLVSLSPEASEAWSDENVSDDEYFVYGSQQDCIHFRVEYLKTCLQVSRNYWDTAIVLLNPEISLIENEWEAWCLDGKLPGANRYKTFWDFMKHEPLQNYEFKF